MCRCTAARACAPPRPLFWSPALPPLDMRGPRAPASVSPPGGAALGPPEPPAKQSRRLRKSLPVECVRRDDDAGRFRAASGQNKRRARLSNARRYITSNRRGFFPVPGVRAKDGLRSGGVVLFDAVRFDVLQC